MQVSTGVTHTGSPAEAQTSVQSTVPVEPQLVLQLVPSWQSMGVSQPEARSSSQSLKPGSQPASTHSPAMQAAEACGITQERPHCPQLLGSESRSVQMLPHATWLPSHSGGGGSPVSSAESPLPPLPLAVPPLPLPIDEVASMPSPAGASSPHASARQGDHPRAEPEGPGGAGVAPVVLTLRRGCPRDPRSSHRR